MTPDPNIPVGSVLTTVPAHKHCEVCGTAMGLDGRVCSPECQVKALEAFRTRKRSVYVFVAAIALVLLFSVYGGKLIGLG
jgi:predicted nucleic acid-binding Zn ribbon protein